MDLNCSKDFPTTEVLYQLLSSDVTVLIFTIIDVVISCIVIGLFAEEVWFLFNNCHDSSKRTKTILLLALYPVVVSASTLCILVPTSTLIGEFVSSIYLSFCVYIFVNLVIDYLGGLNNVLCNYKDRTISFRTGPCCCCCVCLDSIPITRRTMMVIKGLVLQVAILRPILLFFLAVLWSDGKYSLQQQSDFTNPASYINLVNAVSTLLSIYGLMVTFRSTRVKLKTYRLTLKFISLQGSLLFMNVQSFITGFLGRAGIPECSNTIGSPIRASRVNHFLLVLEMFLFALLARFAYRTVEESSDDDEEDRANETKVESNDADTNENKNGVADTNLGIDDEVSSSPQEVDDLLD
ncbi:organic solute transporter subunit alpha-like [Pecten maximus]|uniref:organic solute transporter subunit alpha-like n=1 Tax=Pecten maximus TaxID=6579 RepID=UPI0014589461|nr:organic solute transporter subunit alpha-like [Pecten maximus]XP_033738290.1 organic solute transporter subunit alpha-like [Pecten maximus]